MAFDKVVDSAQLDAALTYTANRIRNKTGNTNQIMWDSAKGFGDAVDAITSGSSAPESDPREVYQGTRPAEWLRLPDYDKVANRTMYCLVKLFPTGTNKVSFGFRCEGTCTMYAGKVINGDFVAFENDEPVTVAGTGVSGDKIITRVFNYDDYTDTMSDGTKQLVIKLEVSGWWYRIWSNTRTGSYYINDGIVDMILRKDDTASDTFVTEGNLMGCRYFYNFGNKIPVCLKAAEYVKTQSGICEPNTRLYITTLKSFLGTVKLVSFWETFRQCTSLQELTCDISETTGWTNPFYTGQPCYSLRKLLFTGGENLTSFPGDINLSNTSLGVDAVLAFFNTLPDISTSDTRTITLTKTPAVAEGIPEATLAVATNKGWTVVTK